MKSLLRWLGKSSPQVDATVTAEAMESLIAQGNASEDRGEYQAARALYQRAIAMSPESARAHLNLGNALAGLGERNAAMASYDRAIGLQQDLLPAHLSAGALLLASGEPGAAERAYRRALEIAPASAAAWLGLGCALDDQSMDAEAAFRAALGLAPGHAGAASRLAQWLRARGRARDGLRVLEAALVDKPDEVLLLKTLGVIVASVGDPTRAYATNRRVLQVSPRDWEAWDNLLCNLNLIPEADASQILAEHRRFGEAMDQALEPAASAPVRHERKRLKVGYVSADFRVHPVSCFIEPLLRHHDRARFDVHCFYNFPSGDHITQRLFELAEHWHDIVGMSDEETARRIRDNGIDILVDLSGHTLHNRLGVFARRPAPLQFTWLGYLCTTGLRVMDYRLCDAYTDPLGQAESWQVEKPMRLPSSQWCYTPQVEPPTPSPLPMLTNGHWTFGSFNQEAKLNESVLHAWADILTATPGSRIRLLGVTCDLVEEKIRSIFAGHAVDASRIDIVGRLPKGVYFAAYRDVDIALDTFPYNGATTTCDALLMGVPVVTVAGNRALARGGVSLLSNVGLTEWIADSPQTIVDVVKARIADPQGLAQLRAELPARMRASPLMDGPRFTRDLEALYLRAWEQRGT